jgi:hypothetical protein
MIQDSGFKSKTVSHHFRCRTRKEKVLALWLSHLTKPSHPSVYQLTLFKVGLHLLPSAAAVGRRCREKVTQ